MNDPMPTIQGRVNYISFRKGYYNVLFVPFQSDVQLVIARNLTYAEAKKLHDDLNDALDDARDRFYAEGDLRAERTKEE